MSSGFVIAVDPSEMASRFASEDPTDDELESVSEEDVAEFFASSADDFESRIAPLLDRIPDRESDLIQLYFIHGKRQADIAEIFGVTQAAVSYRLDRGIKRIQFLLSIPQVLEEELRRDLAPVFSASSPCPKCVAAAYAAPKQDDYESQEEYDVALQVYLEMASQPRELAAPSPDCLVCKGSGSILIDVEILVGMWATTCQSEVATMLGLTQGRVRHRFFKAVKTLEKASADSETLQPYHKIFRTIAAKKFNILREVRLPQWANRGGDECF